MAVIRYRAFRSRGVYINSAAFMREIARTYQKELYPAVISACLRFTSGWKTQVEWGQDIYVTTKGVTHYLFPVEGADVWTWVSRGVPGRFIAVNPNKPTFSRFGRYKPKLSLQRYAAYTQPGGLWGGPGMRYGPVGYRSEVWWPGIRPRLFEEQIANQLRSFHIRITEEGMRRGVAAAQREGY